MVAYVVTAVLLVVLTAVRFRRQIRDRWGSPDLVPGVVLISAPEQVRDQVLAVTGRFTVNSERRQRPRDDGSTERIFSVVVRTINGRESQTVDDLRAALARLRAAAQPGQEIFVSRVPKIRLESPTTRETDVRQLPNLELALTAANLHRADPPPSVVPTVVVVDSGFAPSVLDNRPGQPPITELPVAWPGQPPPAAPSKDHHGSAVVAVLRAAAPDVNFKYISLPDDEKRPDWFQAAFDEIAFQRRWDPMVVNLSWTYRTTLHTGEFERAVERSIFNAWLEGVVFVAASGNAQRTGTSLTPWKDVGILPFPARLDTVIAVGAVDDARVRMPNSRYGRRHAPALFTVSCGQPEPDGRYFLIEVLGKPYGGTSMATALASGLIARGADLPAQPPLIRDAVGRKAWAQEQAQDLLRLAVSPFAAAGPDEYGHGVLRLP